MKVFPDSFNSDSIEIEIRGDRRRVRAFQNGDHILVYGLAVKYQTGKKIWPGMAIYWPASGNINNLQASNMDHRARSNFVLLVGYWADYADTKARSQHKAVA